MWGGGGFRVPTGICIFWIFCILRFNWRVIALQYWVDFCHVSTQISHRYTCLLLLEPPSPSYPSLLGYFNGVFWNSGQRVRIFNGTISLDLSCTSLKILNTLIPTRKHFLSHVMDRPALPPCSYNAPLQSFKCLACHKSSGLPRTFNSQDDFLFVEWFRLTLKPSSLISLPQCLSRFLSSLHPSILQRFAIDSQDRQLELKATFSDYVQIVWS